MREFQTLLELVRRKSEIDGESDWPSGATMYYLSEIKKEVDEVAEELPKRRTCFIEDEFGDVLWDYLSALVSAEKEKDVNLQNVLDRACRKYEERVSGIERGELWDDVKERQKARLASEQESQDRT